MLIVMLSVSGSEKALGGIWYVQGWLWTQVVAGIPALTMGGRLIQRTNELMVQALKLSQTFMATEWLPA
jgi:hypothetical protein